MASILDMARDLGRALSGSDEYKAFKLAQGAVEGNTAAQVMLKDFRTLQFAVERSRMLGDEVPERLSQELGAKQELVLCNSTVRDFLIAEQAFGNLMMAVQRILGEAVGLDIDGDGASMVDGADTPDCGCGEAGHGEGCSCS